ncbi:MAG TPA: hypothetical protein VFF79_10950 [Conexibacter sp.]|jgi:hypothetical protein|nr:hypothetical protein [Conexibacter sp.]
MLRTVHHAPELERQLLRRSVMALSAGRDRCDGCHRTPLVGEHVHVYDGGRVLCELCRRERREAPLRSQSVLGSEHGQTVRLTDRRPAPPQRHAA